MKQKKKFSAGVLLLWLLMLVVGLGSLYGGSNLIIDPSGKRLDIPLFFLTDSPFRTYLIPGLILFFMLGLFPLMSLYGLIFQPNTKGLNFLNIYKQQHWGWTYALYTGIMLVVWMDVQIFWIGHSASVQSYFAFTGIIIIIVALLPGVQKKYLLS
jgi:hypothetical protein